MSLNPMSCPSLKLYELIFIRRVQITRRRCQIIGVDFFTFLHENKLSAIRNHARIVRLRLLVSWLSLDLLYNLLARNNFAENNVKTIKMARWLCRDEELGAICVFAAICH